MAYTEASLLKNFLLPPANLSAILSFEEFADLFPHSQQTNTQTRHLYRKLNDLRNANVEQVNDDIAREIKRGERQRQQVVQARLRGPPKGTGFANGEKSQVQGGGSDNSSSPSASERHTLSSLLPEMEEACQDIEAEIAKTNDEVMAMSREIERWLDSMGSFNGRRFTKALREDILEDLKGLDEACIAKAMNKNN